MKGCTNKKSSQNKGTKINACNLSFKLEAGTAGKFFFGGGGGCRDTCQHHLGGEEVVGMRPSRILLRYKLKPV